MRYSFAGIWEIDPHGVEEHLRRFRSSFDGPLGHIRGAILIPLGELAERAGELARDRPIVAVARAGTRSAQATVIMREAAAKIGQPATFRIASAFLHATLLCEETVSWALNEERESDGV